MFIHFLPITTCPNYPCLLFVLSFFITFFAHPLHLPYSSTVSLYLSCMIFFFFYSSLSLASIIHVFSSSFIYLINLFTHLFVCVCLYPPSTNIPFSLLYLQAEELNSIVGHAFRLAYAAHLQKSGTTVRDVIPTHSHGNTPPLPHTLAHHPSQSHSHTHTPSPSGTPLHIHAQTHTTHTHPHQRACDHSCSPSPLQVWGWSLFISLFICVLNYLFLYLFYID